MAEFVPVQFSKLGKKVTDLFKKNYEFDNQIATKNSTSVNNAKLTIEAGSKNQTNGFAKITYDSKDLGKFELDFPTAGMPSAKVTNTGVMDGLELVLAGNGKPAGSLEANYAQDFVACSTKVCSNNNVNASVTIGHDDVTCGGAVALNMAGEIKNWDVAAEWAKKDFTMTVHTAKKGEDITLSFFQRVSGQTSVGARFFHQPESDDKKLTFGMDHQYDSKTNIKAKADTAGVVSTAIQHRLSNPSFLLNVSAEFNALSKDRLNAQKLGVSAKFGDY